MTTSGGSGAGSRSRPAPIPMAIPRARIASSAAAMSRRVRNGSVDIDRSEPRARHAGRCGVVATSARAASTYRRGATSAPSASQSARMRSRSASRITRSVLPARRIARRPRLRRASPGARSAASTSRSQVRCRGSRRPPPPAGRGSTRSASTARWSSVSDWNARSSSSRFATDAWESLTEAKSGTTSRVTTACRRAVRRFDWQERRTTRYIQASNRSGSRSPGRSPPDTDQGGLEHVACRVAVADDPQGERIDAVADLRRELREGIAIAVLRPLDKAPVH